MRVFIAGATGIIGRRVVRLLLADGHAVTGLSRSEGNDALLRSLGAGPVRGNLFSREEMARVTEGCDAILHLATSIPRTRRPRRRDWLLNDRIRREGTACLLEAATSHSVRLYLQQSVTFLYGNRNGAWVDETAGISGRLSPILRSAADMERRVLSATAQGLPAVILRFGSFYAADSPQTAGMFQGITLGRFPVIGSGDAFWNMVHIDDAATAVARTVDGHGHIPPGVYNVCDDEPVQYRNLVSFIAGELRALPPKQISPFIARLAVGTDLLSVLLASARCSNAKAKRTLAWKPAFPTYREGIRIEAERWMQSLKPDSSPPVSTREDI